MLLPLPTPEEMSLWDRTTIEEFGIPGNTLMESASREAVEVLLEEFGDLEDMRVFCFAGSGNNGGDGFAMARHLTDLGAEVTVLHTRPKKKYRGDARANLVLVQKLGIPLRYLPGTNLDELPQPDVVIDALLGTGFHGQLRQDYLDLIRTINLMGERAFVLSVDIPSGLNGLTGHAQPEAVRADATATFQAPKLGLVQPEARPFTGELHVCPIGIPLKIQELHPATHQLITGEIMDMIPVPAPDMHKGRGGHLLVLGGSRGLTGAPHLAALGGLRSGAGLVTVACPGDLADTIKAGSPDIMTLALGNTDQWTPALADLLLPELSRFDSLVVGPGMGRADSAAKFLAALLPRLTVPVVLDADALFLLAKFPELLDKLPEHSVFTPHPGEMARLMDTDTGSIQADRLGAAADFLQKRDVTLVLKGAATIVANQDLTCLSPFAEPNLSVAGSGDVLSGIIGALLARGIPAMQAACTGVFWHGLAGQALAEDFPLRGNLASEIARMLPHVAPHNRF